ncbi:NERD domain-containing protein [Virgibacillus sp. NKC19-3]|uniref:nuclease-related domain-containing protein n=1 Tax=Virgibacillus saliphilus TaxID=2831674 RepID=UPI001C9A5589|nr:nuclease-related domain-containing protein [Virgibacillus sp. NKC19-3]MBY7144619.1 NERD domain-containing protein [Virgibacillus sp. NKC19-3]
MKVRPKPLVLKKYEILISRLKRNFPRFNEVTREYQKRKRGYEGEIQVDYHLAFLPQQFLILRDICLHVSHRTFQMGNLIFSQNALFIVEVKNYQGTIIFDTILDQFTRDDGQMETGFNHPISQTELQRYNLQQWLQERNFATIPIYAFTAISDPSTIIKVDGDKDKIAKVVAHGSSIPRKIMHFNKQLSAHDSLGDRKIGTMVQKESKEYDMDIMKRYDVKMSDLLPGVKCPACKFLGMERIYNKWQCRKCHHCSSNAHKQAIDDYMLFGNNWITNSICRWWLQINSKNTVTRLLKKSSLRYNAKRRRWEK